jgi:hypothetical protein
MFYKNDNGQLLEAPNFVYSKNYTLLVADKDTYTYPVDGWKWFDSEDEARLEYNLPKPEEQK